MNGLKRTLLNRTTGWPVLTEGTQFNRRQPCGLCGKDSGLEVARARFWDLADLSFVRCLDCGLSQVDPMLSEEVTSIGCYAYFLKESAREGKRNLEKKMVRSFRRGVYLGLKLKGRGENPKNILEVGAGDGYFSKGLQFVFPNAQVTCLDIVPEILAAIKKNHDFQVLLGVPENLPELCGGKKFDLLVARDIIEHVSQPAAVLQAFSKVLDVGGLLHIITPNGYEDIWRPYCRWKLKAEPSQLLINHVSYFEPRALRKYIEALGFTTQTWFIYDFNGTRWGRARTITEKQMGDPLLDISAQETIQELKSASSSLEVTEDPLKKSWWHSLKLRWLTELYCFLKEQRWFWLNADHGIGHEIFATFKKRH